MKICYRDRSYVIWLEATERPSGTQMGRAYDGGAMTDDIPPIPRLHEERKSSTTQVGAKSLAPVDRSKFLYRMDRRDHVSMKFLWRLISVITLILRLQ